VLQKADATRLVFANKICRAEKKTTKELEAYDNIGIMYYYLGNINKAIYYHNRMMKGELEGDTAEKRWNVEALAKARAQQAYKRESKDGLNTIFHKYKTIKENTDEVKLPHEDPQEKLW
jgi:hypothetical protein